MNTKLNNIIRKVSSRWEKSYTKRGKDNREWKELSKAKIRYLKEDLRKEIQAYIREHGIGG